MKKKIAMCISGYLRTFEECWPSIKKNIIDGNDIDIFIHTYDKLGNSKGWRHPMNLTEDININFLENIPNIKIIVTEKFENIKYKFEKVRKLHPGVTNINVIETIFYKIYMCNELRKQYEKEHDFKYDLVIRMRGDQIFERKINLDFPEDKILINAYPWGDEDYIQHHQENNADGSINMNLENVCLNDRFAVGSPEKIDYLSELYLHFEELIENEQWIELEFLTHKHLSKKNIQLEKRNMNFYVKHKPPRLFKP